MFNAQIFEKNKGKDVYIKIENGRDGNNLVILDTPNSAFFKTSIPIRKIYAEYKQSDYTRCSLIFQLPTQELSLSFNDPVDAEAIYRFICDKSDVHAENTAMQQMDAEIRLYWPMPLTTLV
ncbi:hypothetical protein TVAG_385860 [Trichomonas vaginalis G3]|uniref:Uncharacterized protein n=1 Tax=Trichomonas vaginalis (strain ATCC PRA-98 / G3) TaxID=412133 RepID=A2G1V0_TRIV3|nr:hypothetical protein TVAG_385860 [Trichomonas vaginalis G3]|eukprot:XP_001301808.1 hypothetical protein [Trichomonas vaginalis G3]